MPTQPPAENMAAPADDGVADDRPIHDATIAAYVLLLAATTLAWAPMCSRYVPLADDIDLAHILDHGLLFYLTHTPIQAIGITGMLGNLVSAIGVRHPDEYGPAMVTLHAAVACLLLKTAHKLLGDLRLSLLLAIAFAVYPATGQAIMWATASPIVILEGLFLLLILFLLRFADKSHWRSFGFLIGFAASFVILWQVPSADRPGRAASTENSTGLILPYLSQYITALTFEPWFSHDARGLLTWGWSASMTCACIAAIAAGGWAFMRFRKSSSAIPDHVPRPDFALSSTLLILAMGMTTVYAAALGAYPKFRIQYVLSPAMLLLVGWVLRRSNLRIGRWAAPIAVVLIVSGVASTWLNVNIWRHESFCLSRLANTAITNNISGPAQIEWNPDIYRAWPHAALLWGFRFDDTSVMEHPFVARGLPRLKRADADAPVTFKFDPASESWRIERTRPAFAEGTRR